MSASRAYFINALTGEELSDHPLNGKVWVGTSGNVHQNGEFVRGTATSVTIASYADLHRIVGEKQVTAEDFDVPVVVKIWSPNNDQDWRYLLKEDARLTDIDFARARRCVDRSN